MPQTRRPHSASRRRGVESRLLRRACRALLWHLLTGAVCLERGLRRAWEGCQPVGGRPAGREWSNGRFHSPCVVLATDIERAALTAPVTWLRGVPWSRLALGVLAVGAFLGGALVGTVHKGQGRLWPGQAAIAGPHGPAPERITAADRASLARCVEAAHGPLRGDSMGAERRSAEEAGPAPMVLRRGATDDRIVSLTFDDGPNPDTTPRILAALREENVPATFFLIGSEVERHPDVAREMRAEGHALGNHTWHHFYLDHMDARSTAAEMEITSRLIEKVTGCHPVWFRPPGGYYTQDVLATARALNQRIVLWSQDARDWAEPGAEAIHRRVLADLQPGAILLLHDTSSQTAAVLPRLLRDVKARGYRFVPLETLAGR